MSLVRKLKPDRNFTGALVYLAMLPIFGIAALIFGLPAGLIILALLIWISASFFLLVFIRTGNRGHLFIFGYGVFLGFMATLLRYYINTGKNENREFVLAYFSLLVFFGIGTIYLVLTRKAKWRGREIFELAAEPVDEIDNGYTSRPRPVGKVEYSPEQIREFAHFASQHLIALPYFTSKNTTLVVIKMGDEYRRLLGMSGDYRDATWVNFDVDGEVSVHIARTDYLDYRDSLAFDPLCVSLGQVFIDFIELYTKGEGVRVIDRIDDLGISVFS
jgi:hypothetical protein